MFCASHMTEAERSSLRLYRLASGPLVLLDPLIITYRAKGDTLKRSSVPSLARLEA
jgi:hypothetical protein